MAVMLGQMQPYADPHQRACGDQLPGDGVIVQDDRKGRAEKRSDREVRTGPRRTEVAQRDYEQDEADAVSDEPQRCRHAEQVGGWQCAANK